MEEIEFSQRLTILTLMLVSDTVFTLNLWKFSLVIEKKITGRRNWRDKIFLVTLITFVSAELAYFALGCIQKKQSDYCFVGLMCCITVILLDAIVRIRSQLGEHDKNFKIFLLLLLAYVLSIIAFAYSSVEN